MVLHVDKIEIRNIFEPESLQNIYWADRRLVIVIAVKTLLNIYTIINPVVL